MFLNMLNTLILAGFSVSYIACIAVSHWRNCPLLVRAVWVLTANFVVGNLAIVASGRDAPVEWLLVFDVASAFVMLWHPAAKTQAILGMVYGAQIVMHAVHWAAGFPGGAWFYMLMLNVGGGLQIAFLLNGAVNGDGRRKVVWTGGNRGGAVLDIPARASRVPTRAA